MTARQNWITVASADHVARGLAGGFCQVNHGKAAPLHRMRPGDRLIIYSPHQIMGGRDRLMSFTAFGLVADAPVEHVTMAPDFHPFRRKVTYLPARVVPVDDLRSDPAFVLAGPGWGAKLRFGLLAVDDASARAVATAMAVDPSAAGFG